MTDFTIGSVPYLNARPLTDWFSQTDEGRASGTMLSFAVPSELGKALERDELDAALVSSVAWIRRPYLRYAPKIAIASDGPVRSVRIFHKVPLESVKSVALDTSSLTSVCLTKILLAERFGADPTYENMAPDLDAMLENHDAALIIGDPANLVIDSAVDSIDLGETWTAWTRLPFVYALWIGPENRLTPERVALLQKAKAWGMKNVEEIAARRGPEHGKSAAYAQSYLTEAIKFDLDEPQERGLALFAEKVRAHGLA